MQNFPHTQPHELPALAAAQQRIHELEAQLTAARCQLQQIIETTPMSAASLDTEMRYLHTNTSEQLIQQQTLLRTVLDTIPVRVFWKDRDSRYLGANRLFAHDMGVESPEVLIGKTDADFFPSSIAEYFHQVDRTVIASGQSSWAAAELTNLPNGQTLWYEGSKYPLRNVQDDIIGILGVYTDITRRKANEEALRSREALYRTLLNNLPKIALVVYDREMRFVLADGTELPYLGYDQNRMIGKQLEEIDPPQNPQIIREAIQNTFEGDIITHEMTYRQEQYQVTYVPIFDDNNEITNVMELTQNVTERKQSEVALRESEARYRMLAANLPEMTVALYDHDLRFLLIDGLDIGASGLRKEHEGLTLYEVSPQPVIDFFEPSMRAALNGKPQVLESVSLLNGQSFMLMFMPIRSGDEEIINGLVLSQNITDRRIAEQEWQRLFYQTETLYNLSRALRAVENIEDVLRAIEQAAGEHDPIAFTLFY